VCTHTSRCNTCCVLTAARGVQKIKKPTPSDAQVSRRHTVRALCPTTRTCKKTIRGPTVSSSRACKKNYSWSNWSVRHAPVKKLFVVQLSVRHAPAWTIRLKKSLPRGTRSNSERCGHGCFRDGRVAHVLRTRSTTSVGQLLCRNAGRGDRCQTRCASPRPPCFSGAALGRTRSAVTPPKGSDSHSKAPLQGPTSEARAGSWEQSRLGPFCFSSATMLFRSSPRPHAFRSYSTEG